MQSLMIIEMQNVIDPPISDCMLCMRRLRGRRYRQVNILEQNEYCRSHCRVQQRREAGDMKLWWNRAAPIRRKCKYDREQGFCY